MPAVPAWVDLRLDGNQGRAPSASFFDALLRDPELLRCYPRDDRLERSLAAHHGLPVDRFFVGAGADDVLDRLCRACLEPGREAILPVPTFEMLERYVALSGARARTVPWLEGAWPAQQVMELGSADTALVAIVSPNNPTGLVATADDVRAVCAAFPQSLVLVDAAYAEFGGEDLTRAALGFDNAVVVRTFSKAFGLAGLRVGYAIATPRVVGWLRVVGSPFTCGTWSRAAAVHRLATGRDEMQAYVHAVEAERTELIGALRAFGLEALPSAGNFVFVRGGDPTWLRDALAGVGIAVRAFPAGVRITLPADCAAFARLRAALAAAVQPKALLLDLDGVLADIEGRRALASVADLQALATLLPIGVVTNCPRRLAESVLARHGFTAHVAALVAAEDGPGKPDPAPVRLLLQRLGHTAAWMLGDNASDFEAARAAGVVPLAVAGSGTEAERREQLCRQGAVRIVDGLAGLRQLLAPRP
ncbi:MAG TPA: aminotransferase class I/II-fold pyridoxal phosphate-dependent enzyme [Planctomycetota bacterium]|nr:aminotransferase class I/II-fold pyridoxal phosphate-dependent enzyme [Planctomycetota bacterium]